MINGKTRSTLLGLVGAYLMYLAYQLFDGRADPDTTMTMVPRIVFIVLFALCGLALIVYSLWLWKQALRQDQQEHPQDMDASK